MMRARRRARRRRRPWREISLRSLSATPSTRLHGKVEPKHGKRKVGAAVGGADPKRRTRLRRPSRLLPAGADDSTCIHSSHRPRLSFILHIDSRSPLALLLLFLSLQLPHDHQLHVPNSFGSCHPFPSSVPSRHFLHTCARAPHSHSAAALLLATLVPGV